MRDTPPVSIQSALWRAIFIPILALSLLAAIYSSVNQTFKQIDQFEQINIYLAEQSASASEYALLFNDQNLLSNNIQSLLRQPDVVGVSYYDSKGRRIDSLGTEHKASVDLQPDSEHFYIKKRDLFVVIVPVFYSSNDNANLNNLSNSNTDSQQLSIVGATASNEGPNRDLLGWIQVLASTNDLLLSIISNIAASLLYVITFLIGCGFACRWYIRHCTRPWSHTVDAVTHIANGDYAKARDIQLPVNMLQTKSELRYIANRLDNYRSELEEEIAQTTQEAREHALQLEEKSAQLHIANKEATESNRLKSQFLANISHEVRTPLNAILGYTQLLQKDDLGNQQRSYVDTIELSTNNLLATIGDILDFSKIEAGKLILEPSDFNLRDIIDEVFQTLSSTLLNDDKNIDLIPSYSAQLPEWVRGDAVRVRQILTNLVGNAIKFTQAGSVQVIATLTSQSKNTLGISIQVIDTGMGIPDDKLNQLFKPFSQVDPSRSRNFAGTGLGLVITRKLIEQMNGSINVTSELGRGSNFYFSIQLTPSDKCSTPLQPLNKHVLIMEPNTNYRNYLRSCLDDIEVTYEYTNTIDQLVSTLHKKNKPFDCALLHVESTAQTSQDTHQLVQYLSTRFNVPCILMTKPTGYISQHSQLHQSVSHILLKPINPSKLYQALTNVEINQTAFDAKHSLTIPDDDPKTDHVNVTDNHINLSGIHILAVDDTPINLQLLGHWLDPHGIKLSLAYSGIQAIDMAENQQFDLILMDIQMPQMDGMETTKRLRQMAAYKETPIIALTAHALAEEQQSILASGMNAYLTKPVNEDILINTILKWCHEERNHSTQVSQQIAQVFHLDRALSMAGNKTNAAKELFEMFMESLKEDKRLLHHHYQAQDLNKLIATVHRIHGASKYSGTIEVTKHANFLETHLKELGFDEVDEIFQDFTDAISRLENIQTLIPWPPASQTQAHNDAHQINSKTN
ncbi:hybrid sensor histidine kinase/response regulator [Marinomonas piezotolerans]|uniref:histidine kinase n=1 Tax=Marinomonas piezotolerans TaxID=2213058 RepID=A0A370UAB8_9GAMM|nr:response regulator [Marinomonas piezotolerans]RDL44713.1 hybrid sensor histidine kinase/response regulator [Marinomonas piezotolerans]